MNPTTTSTPTPPRPRRVVRLELEGDGDGRALRGASARDVRLIQELARVRPFKWGCLMRGAIDQRYAIRIDPEPPGPGRPVLTLSVTEDVDRSRLEVGPLGEGDRQRLLELFPERGQAEDLPTPGTLIVRALAAGLAVLVRCDLKLIR
jgi:hypothetical protein